MDEEQNKRASIDYRFSKGRHNVKIVDQYSKNHQLKINLDQK